jgi:hypothetical protein
MNFRVGDLIVHKHRKHYGLVAKAMKPYWLNYSLRDEQYDITWFDEELNNRHNAGLLQIEHGDMLVKAT